MVRRRRIMAVVLSATVILLLLTYMDLGGTEVSSLNITFKNPYKGLYEKYMFDFENAFQQSVNESALHVIVMAQFRTGSTITGEIFNQNPTLFYLFEPLRVPKCVEKFALMDDNEDTNAKLLTRINRCHFSPKTTACIANFRLGVIRSKNVARICKKLTGVNYNSCPTATPDLFRKECLKYRGRMAMKVIRMNLNDIKEVLEQTKLNIKVIHLVRDPRGTANSRRIYLMSANERHSILNATTAETPVSKGNETLHIRSLRRVGLFDPPKTPDRATINDMCRRMRQNVGTAISRPEWLKDRYKLVRYEDISARPIETTRKIYDFLGEPAPNNVLRWLDENTRDTVKSEQQMFNTHKNSTATSMKWRQYFSYYEARQVQSICGDVMKMLGYKHIRHHADVRNSNFAVTLPLKLGSDIAIV
ncbi:carbohydrate sulfotransferase 1-like [Amphiura filiformis]|uniref:carbohydrate sulfotransferase 1-like n=1 Tax=Amphiura filiformis TaxID=82378 RepID=UPI003B22695D